MTNKQFNGQMKKLLDELQNSPDRRTDGLIIAKAVNLGMIYQEQKIKEGIKIVFEELHNNNN